MVVKSGERFEAGGGRRFAERCNGQEKMRMFVEVFNKR